MTWQISLSSDAAKWFREVDPHVARRVRDALRAIESLNSPRDRGKALSGNLAGLWRYRVGDYRVICDIRDDELVILALEIGTRDSIYD